MIEASVRMYSRPPAFLDVQSCRGWLAGLAAEHPARHPARLLAEVNLLNGQPLTAPDRLSILEMLREPAHRASAAAARRFAWRGLPLAASEQAAFEANVALARSLARGYAMCLEARAPDDASGMQEAALAAQRSLATLAWEQYDGIRVGMDPPPAFWRALHHLYSAAEAVGVAGTELADPLFDVPSVSPAAVYVQVLLLHLADARELDPAELESARSHLARWSRHLPLSVWPPPDFRIPPVAVDCSGGEPPSQVPPQGGRLRYVDITQLAAKLKRRLQPRAGVPEPEQALWRHLYERCCKGALVRFEPRGDAHAECRLVAGLEAAHYYLSGRKPFREPADAASLARWEVEKIATLRMMAPRVEEGFSRSRGFRVETWSLVRDCGAETTVSRAPGEDGRLARAQLVAFKRPPDEGYALGCVRWVRLDARGGLCACVRLIPGVPRPVAIRVAGRGPSQWRPGFSLAGERGASLVGPRGAFCPGDVIDVLDNGRRSAKLLAFLERGMDFERASCESP
ncbi:MAG: hypothetical protein OHK0026_10960 [Rhodocyclaceae bacterium]